MTEKTKTSTDISPSSSQSKKKEKEILIKSLTLIKENEPEKKSDKKFLGIKRKLFKKIKNKKEIKEKRLSVSKQIDYFINNTNNKKNEECIICLEKISFQERHFLHCGHIFHCDCINKWLNMDKNKCPTCKQNIECDKSLSEESISLENNNEIIVQNNNVLSKGQLTIIFLYIWILTIICMSKGLYSLG